jgi:DNA-binding transcriptional ArsR family regulator
MAKPKERPTLEKELFERQARICKAFANPTRLKLLDLIANKDRQVSDIQRELGISKANLSQHLAILKAAGIVISHRNGKQLSCSLAMPEIKEACQLIRNVLKIQIREQRKLPL